MVIILREESTDGRYLGLVFLFLSFPLSTLALIMIPKVLTYRRVTLGIEEKKSKRGESKGVRISGVPGSNVSGSNSNQNSSNFSSSNTYASAPLQQKYSSNVSDLPPVNEHSSLEQESEHIDKESFSEEQMSSVNDLPEADVVGTKNVSLLGTAESTSTTPMDRKTDDATRMNEAEQTPLQTTSELSDDLALETEQDSTSAKKETISPLEAEDHESMKE